MSVIRAPELPEGLDWLNTPRPLTMERRQQPRLAAVRAGGMSAETSHPLLHF